MSRVLRSCSIRSEDPIASKSPTSCRRQRKGALCSTSLRQFSSPLKTVMAALAREPGGGLIVSPDSFTVTNIGLIIDLAARHRLPAIYSERNFAADGGLMSYGADYIDMYRQAAIYVDRILRGDKPADLPVQQPTKFFLVINLKTAKTLGLTVSDGMQLLADQVID